MTSVLPECMGDDSTDRAIWATFKTSSHLHQRNRSCRDPTMDHCQHEFSEDALDISFISLRDGKGMNPAGIHLTD